MNDESRSGGVDYWSSIYSFVQSLGVADILHMVCRKAIDVDAIGRLFHPPAACSSSGPLAN
jgi:hypothetical protein